jgi:hypothetical protein
MRLHEAARAQGQGRIGIGEDEQQVVRRLRTGLQCAQRFQHGGGRHGAVGRAERHAAGIVVGGGQHGRCLGPGAAGLAHQDVVHHRQGHAHVAGEVGRRRLHGLGLDFGHQAEGADLVDEVGARLRVGAAADRAGRTRQRLHVGQRARGDESVGRRTGRDRFGARLQR